MIPILNLLGVSLAALASVVLFRGAKESLSARILCIIGMLLPLGACLIFGSDSKAFIMLMPLGLILTAAGGYLFSNIEEPKDNTKLIYGAVFTALGGLSLAGWSLVSAG